MQTVPKRSEDRRRRHALASAKKRRARKKPPAEKKPKLADAMRDAFSPATSTADKLRRAEGTETHLLALIEAGKIPEAARFYATPEAAVEASYWEDQGWTLDEAVALSFGKDPRVVTRKRLLQYHDVWPFSRAYYERTKLARESIFADKLVTTPTAFIEWAKSVGIEMPPQLVADVERVVDKARSRPRRLSTKQENAALKLELEKSIAALSDANAQIAELEQKLKEEQISPKSKTTVDKIAFALARMSGFTTDKNNAAVGKIKRLLPDEFISDGTLRTWMTFAYQRYRETPKKSE